MSLHAVSDGFLAVRVAQGDGAAFAELARRYRPLILHATGRRTLGLEFEDACQEALLALFHACMKYDPDRGRFRGLASLRVRSGVRNARIDASRPSRRLLTEAYRDGDEPTRQLAERAAAPEGSDPARVIVLREELRQHAQRAHRKANAPGGDLRRRYSDEQIERALALIAEGKTLKETALEVGAPANRVARWVTRAGQSRPAGRRRYSPAEVREAITLVHKGASLRQAAAAVGASNATVLRWLRQAV
jgi:RNA polymerase sigma factor (sigma-70 family)